MGEETFGPYRLRSLLGRGGMGEVWLAHHDGLDREVALKRIAGPPSRDPELQARFRREARLAARLTSMHAVPIHEFGEIDGRLYLDMRYVRGPDLRKVLDDHPYGLAPAAAYDVVVQLADALDSAHELELVHRDVKPSNVLVDSSRGRWFCYLADFGVAVPARGADTRITSTGATIGTPAYMAPELLDEGGEPSVASDVYALGCLLHELLTGRTPFPGASHAAVLYQHMHAEPPRPSASRPELAAFDAVVLTAMAKDPARRFRSAGDLARALPQPGPAYPPPVTATSGYAPPVPPGPTPPPEWTPPGSTPVPGPRRRSRVAIALGLAFATLVAAGGVYLGVRVLGGDEAPAPAPVAIPTAVTAELLPLPYQFGYELEVSPDGRRLYVLGDDGSSTTLSVLDTATRTVTRKIPVDPKAYGLAVGPDGSRAYVTAPGSDDAPGTGLQVVDLGSGRVSAELKDVGARPSRPVLSPDGTRLYVVVNGPGDGTGPGSVVTVDTARAVVTSRTQVGPVPGQIAVTRDGRTLYVANYGASDKAGTSVSVIDATTSRVVRTIPTRNDPLGLVLSPDDRTLYVGTNAGRAGGTLDVIDTGTATATPVTPPGLDVTGSLVRTPDGSRILVPSSGTDDAPARSVTVLAADGSLVGTPATLAGRPNAVAATPDGHHAYVTTYQPGGLWYLSFP